MTLVASGDLMRYRAILFDLDETLLDDDAGMRLAVADVVSQLAGRDARIHPGALERTFLGVSDAFWTRAGSAAGVRDGHEARIRVWREALQACGYEATAATIAATLYADARARHYRLFPDVLDVLGALKLRAQLALVTNGAASTQHAKVHVTGIKSFFDSIVISGEVGIGKPDPRIFRLALTQLGCPAHNAVHVGDSLEHDVAGARAAGLAAVWLNRRPAAPAERVVQEISSLLELPRLLDSG